MNIICKIKEKNAERKLKKQKELEAQQTQALDSFEKKLLDMADSLGIELQYRTHEEFKDAMINNKPFVLK